MVKLFSVQCFDSDQTFRGYRNTDLEVVVVGGMSHQKLCVFDCVELEHLLHGVVKIQLSSQSFRSHPVAADAVILLVEYDMKKTMDISWKSMKTV